MGFCMMITPKTDVAGGVKMQPSSHKLSRLFQLNEEKKVNIIKIV